LRQKIFQHGNRTVAVRARGGHAVIHRQSAKQRQQHQYQRGNRRQCTRGEKSDSRLISERGEVINTGQAHDLPPRVRVPGLAHMRALNFLLIPFQQPALQASASRRRQSMIITHIGFTMNEGKGGWVDESSGRARQD
jgi:hypothetical protein